MAEEIELPPLVVKTAKSEFRLRCHAAAWAGEYGGKMKLQRRHGRDYPGLLLLSATGPGHGRQVGAGNPVPARRRSRVRAGTATAIERMLKARITFDGKPVTLQRRRDEAGPRRDSPGRPGEDSGADAEHERRPPVGRIDRAAIHHAAVEGLDSLAEGNDGRKAAASLSPTASRPPLAC